MARAITPVRKSHALTREDWLTQLAIGMAPRFAELGHPTFPRVRVSVGFPLGQRVARVIGQCWHPELSADGTHEIFISPVIADTLRAADILAHELMHAILGNEAGHGADFARLAKAFDLDGKPTATFGSEAFNAWVTQLIESLGIGEYPHAILDPHGVPNVPRKPGEPGEPGEPPPGPSEGPGRRKQGTRLLKVECPACADEGAPYIARMSQTTIDRGLPICPFHGEPMVQAV